MAAAKGPMVTGRASTKRQEDQKKEKRQAKKILQLQTPTTQHHVHKSPRAKIPPWAPHPLSVGEQRACPASVPEPELVAVV